jgi:hypothetical protein
MMPPSTPFLRRTALPALLGLLLAGAGCLSGAQNPDLQATEDRLDVLQRDIDLLEEFNRLELTKDQLQALIGQVDALHQAMRAREAGRLDILNTIEALLEERRAALLRDEPVPPAVCKQLELQSDTLKNYDRQTDEELTRFAEPLKQTLKPEQIDILTWVSEARLRAMEYLDWVRTMSPEDFQGEAQVGAEGLAEGGALGKAEILDIYTTARDMSEAEYGQAKPRLAERLVPAFRDDSTPIDLLLVQRMQPDRVPLVLKEKLALLK